MSERALIRLEKGDPGVGIGNLAAVLASLGSPENLAQIMAPENDPVSLSRAFDAVPKRGRRFRAGKATAPVEEEPTDAAPQAGRKGIAF